MERDCRAGQVAATVSGETGKYTGSEEGIINRRKELPGSPSPVYSYFTFLLSDDVIVTRASGNGYSANVGRSAKIVFSVLGGC